MVEDNHEYYHAHGHDHLYEAGMSHDHDHATAPLDELTALMHYMTNHKGLADLAHQLSHAGNETAYAKVMTAVAKFDEGNDILKTVLKELGAE